MKANIPFFFISFCLFLFCTSGMSQTVNTITDTRDGKTYDIVKIGDQWWMAENLNYGNQIIGSSGQTNNGITEKYCYNDLESNCNFYGALYQWNEVMNYNISYSNGICPAGWHVPSDDEWKALEIYLGMDEAEADVADDWRGSDQGNQLKTTGTSGFKASNEGYRTLAGSFNLLDQGSLFWTGNNYSRYIYNSQSGIYRNANPDVNYGYAVRCTKQVPYFTKIDFEPDDGNYGSCGNYDYDADLDIKIGNRLYRNNSDKTFTPIDIGVQSTYSDWGDYDNDGDLDLLNNDEGKNNIFRNDGGGVFTKLTDVDLSWNFKGVYKWVDLDADGDLDILIMGNTDMFSTANRTRIFRNDGDDKFTTIEHNLGNLSGTIDLGDYNKDGLCDLLVTGTDNILNKYSVIYRNNGNFNFTDIDARIADVSDGSAQWGDYDNDGDPDILLVGQNKSKISKIYRNDGNNIFTDILAELVPVTGSGCWGDYDNDGDLDVFITGKGQSNDTLNLIFLNTNNIFTELSSGINGYFNKVEPGDFDNDDDLDLFLMGPSPKIYINNLNKVNNAPEEPGYLQSDPYGSHVTLSWNITTDDNTPAKGITYNIKVGTTAGGIDIVTPMSIASGIRKVTRNGNAFNNNFCTLHDLDTGTYYWSVQAVDASQHASGFSVQGLFKIYPLFVMNELFPATLYLTYSNWGDFDKDGWKDAIFTGGNISYADYLCSLYKNNSGENFSEIITGIIGVRSGHTSIGDYDNDNDLDILLNGMTDDTHFIITVYKNLGNNSFTEINFDFDDLNGPASWGDYDNDGDIDIFTTGMDAAGEYKSIFYINGSDDKFTPKQLDIEGLKDGSVSWADYDKDGNLDMLLSGANSNGTVKTSLYRNNGDFKFTLVETGIEQLMGRTAWGDYDNDNDLDILIAGKDSVLNEKTYIFENCGNGCFERSAVPIPFYSKTEIAWGDFNNDHKLDFATSGLLSRGGTLIFENKGNKQFEPLEFIEHGNISWNDFNNDENLDLTLSGGQIHHNSCHIFENKGSYDFESPPIPSDLDFEKYKYGIWLKWHLDGQNENIYSYNIRVGTTSGGTQIVSPLSTADGTRLVYQMGNMQLNNFWKCDSLPLGTYYWSVQAIDQSFQGSAWATEQSFSITQVGANFTYDTACVGSATKFKDQSFTSAESIVAWFWDFGDGSTSTLQNPEHAFSMGGIHNVSLKVSSGNSADSVFKQVYVKDAPVASFIADTVCTGKKTTITNTSQDKGLTINSCQWDLGDNDTSNAKVTVQHLYAADGSYYVQLKLIAENGCVSSFSNNVLVGKIPTPVITYSYGGSALCKGDFSIIQAVQVPQPTYIYKWYRNGDLQTNTMNTFTILNAGIYIAEVTNTIGKCKSESLPEEIIVYERPDTVIIQAVNYNPNICSGTQQVTITAEPNSEIYQYRWFYNDVLIAGADTSQYTDYLKDGSYKTIVGSGQCEVSSQSLILTFKPVPQKPDIYTMGPVVWILACSNDTASEYKWYFNGNILPEARKPLFVANKQTGYYNVRISNGNGCYTSSDTILIGDANKDAFNEDDGTIILYPNPNNGTFNIYFQSNYLGEVQVSIYNILGKLIYSEWFNKTEYLMSDKIDLKKCTPGNYVIKVKSTDNLIFRHLTIEQ
jgi:uncharacterized protein (TIGR02145 family)